MTTMSKIIKENNKQFAQTFIRFFSQFTELQSLCEKIRNYQLQTTCERPFIEESVFNETIKRIEKENIVYPTTDSFISALIMDQLIDKDSLIWSISYASGTIAHFLFRHRSEYSNLTNDFYGWHLVDSKGLTVAHIAASKGALPDDFDKWEIKDVYGTTVGTVQSLCQLMNERN